MAVAAVYAGFPKRDEQNFETVLYSRSYSYVVGSYVQTSDGSAIRAGQIYVEHLVPSKVSAKYPIVMIHGNGISTSAPTYLQS
jgi:hypothetical protein